MATEVKSPTSNMSCSKHKRFIPNCKECKAARENQSLQGEMEIVEEKEEILAVEEEKEEILEEEEEEEEVEIDFDELEGEFNEDEDQVTFNPDGLELSGFNTINFDVGDLPRVGKATAKKLMEAGFSTINSIATAPARLLSEVANLGDATAINLTIAAREAMKIDLTTGIEVWNKRKNLAKISTSCKAFDDLLEGGIETGSITEVYGEFRTGKTQLMHQLCVNAQLSREDGGIDGRVLYVDSEGTFRPERIIQMSESKGLDYNEVLKNIIYARTYSSDHQMMIVKGISKTIAEKNIKLIIVDLLIGHFRSEYIGRGTLAERQQNLNVHLHDLVRIADMFPEVAVIITNQVQAKPDVFFGDPTRSAGGNIMAHTSTTRIYFRKGKGEQRVAKIIDSPNLPEGECIFVITEGGLIDAE